MQIILFFNEKLIHTLLLYFIRKELYSILIIYFINCIVNDIFYLVPLQKMNSNYILCVFIAIHSAVLLCILHKKRIII